MCSWFLLGICLEVIWQAIGMLVVPMNIMGPNDANGDMWCAVIENRNRRFLGKATKYESWYVYQNEEGCEGQRYTIVDVCFFCFS